MDTYQVQRRIRPKGAKREGSLVIPPGTCGFAYILIYIYDRAFFGPSPDGDEDVKHLHIWLTSVNI